MDTSRGQDIHAESADEGGRAAVDLDRISQEALLDLRICELPIQIAGTWVQKQVKRLHKELAARSLQFAPECYLADEWATPVDEPVIGIPFFLAHPRLIALQKDQLIEAEGDTPDWFMQLIRHETGHAISYAYGLNKKRNWQKVFGRSSQEYKDTYRYRPYSRSFVRHLDYYYAQYHPDEDFAETFAVWLTPGLNWRKQYRGWKALEKLEFVDRLMESIAGKPPLKATGEQRWRTDRLRRTLRWHYQRRRQADAEDLPDFHDTNLRRMFQQGREKHENRPKVAKLLQTYRKTLLILVSSWTGERRHMVNEVYKAIHQRSKALRLITEDPEPVVMMQLATYLTTLLMNYRYSNRLRGSKRTND